MTLSDATAWAALALIPLTAGLGFILRRFRSGSFVRRMRPHFWLGYLALIAACAHVALTTGAMGGTNATGIWLATFALIGIGAQAFLGTNLQSPGAYRVPLRRWHVVVFFATFALAFAHVALNAAFLPQSVSSVTAFKEIADGRR